MAGAAQACKTHVFWAPAQLALAVHSAGAATHAPLSTTFPTAFSEFSQTFQGFPTSFQGFPGLSRAAAPLALKCAEFAPQWSKKCHFRAPTDRSWQGKPSVACIFSGKFATIFQPFPQLFLNFPPLSGAFPHFRQTFPYFPALSMGFQTLHFPLVSTSFPYFPRVFRASLSL